MEYTEQMDNQTLLDEIRRLKALIDYDELCQIYNKQAIIKRVNACLKEQKEGVLFVLDIDRFKFINDYFGHLMGDKVLKEVASALLYCVNEMGMVARVGGDEFIVFIPIALSLQEIEEKMEAMKQAVNTIEILECGSPCISIAIYYSVVQIQDTYTSIFDRADNELIQYKRSRSTRQNGFTKITSLIEDNCYDFESFCFLKDRCIDNTYCLLLATITSKDNGVLHFEDESGVQLLYHSINSNLRRGDFFTRYSKNQFLILCKYVEKKHLKFITKRIDAMLQLKGQQAYCLKIEEVSNDTSIAFEMLR